MNRGPLSLFTAATLQVASCEVQGNDMAIWIKLPPCFGSSKHTKYELIMEAVLSRGPRGIIPTTWSTRTMVRSSYHRTANPYVRSWRSAYASPPSRRLEYTSTGAGHLPPLTLVACRPRWDDFQDLGETVAEMSQRLIDEDG